MSTDLPEIPQEYYLDPDPFQYVVVDTVGHGNSFVFHDYVKAIEYAIAVIKPHTDILANGDGVEPLTYDQILHICTGRRLSASIRAGGFVFDCLAYPGGPRCRVLKLPT